MYKGIAGSEGIGIGKVVIIEDHDITIETKHVPETDSEIARLQEAIEKFVEITNKMADKMDETVGKKDADILRGHIQMLQDPMIEEQISSLIIAEKITAEMAVAKGVVEANPDLTIIQFEDGHGFDCDTTVSIALKEGSRDSEFFKKVQKALDSISDEEREEMMKYAVEHQPTED